MSGRPPGVRYARRRWPRGQAILVAVGLVLMYLAYRELYGPEAQQSKARRARARAVELARQNAADRVEFYLNSSKLVVFSATYCPYSIKAKKVGAQGGGARFTCGAPRPPRPPARPRNDAL